jgi:Tol biopolymer transport system component
LAVSIFCSISTSLTLIRSITLFVRASASNEPYFIAVATPTPTPAKGRYNGKLVFTSDRHNSALSIWTMNPDGSSPTRLTDGTVRGGNLPIFTHVYDDRPTWSPDGTKIAFTSNRHCGGPNSVDCGRSIYVMNADGSNVKRILVDGIQETLPEIGSLSWSPDGTRFAFDAGAHFVVEPARPSTNIYVVNSDGTNTTKLTQDSIDVYNGYPTWSPDGSQIAYQSNRTDPNGGHSRNWVMNADGSNQRKITEMHNTSNPLFYYDLEPAWSPDGTKILFVGSRDFNGTRDCFNVNCLEMFVVNPDGTNEQQLTNDQNRGGLQFLPRWSPDGTKIVFSVDLGTVDDNRKNIDRGRAIIVMNADGSNQVNVSNRGKYDFNTTEYVFFDVSADWQPLLSPPNFAPSVVGFSAPSYSAYEDAGTIPITVTRNGNLNDVASCFYHTEEGTANVKHNYAPALGTLRFAPGEASKTISIALTDNGYVQGNLSFKIMLSDNEGNATFVGAIKEAAVTVLDRDTAPRAMNPIDDARYFVRMQYVDFLNREPDQGGWDYWTNEIMRCGGESQCTNNRRIGVSTAYFIEPEFQETGFFVIRFKLLNPPYSAFNFPAIVRDIQTIESGALGQPDAAAKLEANKQAYIQQYFDEDRVTVSWGRADAEYVDLLFKYVKDYAGVTLPQADRDALVAGLNAGTETRPSVFRKVIEHEQYKQAMYNPSFVLMQYYGYLRRDPDQNGYNFWLGQLNRFPLYDTNVAHAMVCSFITSAEYQLRFGSVITHTNSECPR